MSSEPGSLSQSAGGVAGTGSDRHRRLVWVQLGIPDPHFSFAGDNILLAAGYTLAGCRARGSLVGWTTEILDHDTSTYAGDAALLAAILERSPDAVCFSCFVWNVERSLWLGQQIKQIRPAVWLIFGGPEIHPDSPFWQTADADALVCGEGETGLPLAIAGLDGEATRPLRIMAPLLENLSEVPDPYSEGILSPGPDGNCYLETMRGCPYRCQYCFYSKRNRRMRFHDEAALAHFFRWAHARGDVRDVYLVDPSFNVTPALPERLRRLARLNRDRIPLHTETRLEEITPELADLFREAGFESVEVGLQSIHPEVCAGVGRHLDLESFTRGAAAMKQAGIRLELGIILGLPGDDLDGFTATVEWLADHGLIDETVVFILSLLPGTELRVRAVREGWHFMDGPPYYLLEGGGWHQAAILEALYRMEDIGGSEYYPRLNPFAIECNRVPVRTTQSLAIGADGHWNRSELLNASLAQVVRLDISLPMAGEPFRELLELGRRYRRGNPFAMVILVIDSPRPLGETQAKELRRVFSGTQYYWQRINCFNENLVNSADCQLFQHLPPINYGGWLQGLDNAEHLLIDVPARVEDFLQLTSTLRDAGLPNRLYLRSKEPLSEDYRIEIQQEMVNLYYDWFEE